MSEGERKVLELTNFRMAGFLSARGATLVDTRLNAKRELVFRFGDEDGVATTVLIQYAGSAEERYDSACRAMHELVRTLKG